MDWSIKKGKDIKLNVRPVTVCVYHEYVFEGPCRFGTGDQLTKEFDLMNAAELHKRFVDNVQNNLGALDYVNVMEPVMIQRDETFPVRDDDLKAAGKDVEEVDIYLMNIFPFGVDWVLEFEKRYNKPMALMHFGSNDAIFVSALTARGYEAHCWYNWDEAAREAKILRARKVLSHTKVLCLPRANSTVSISAPDSFIDHNAVTKKLGVEFKYYNMHEFLDQTRLVDPMTNPTTPGRRGENLTEEEVAEVKDRTKKLMEGAEVADISEEFLFNSCKANYLAQKLMAQFDCNAFTAPCPDMCATRRLNEEQFTLCLNHSLNNEEGICSACEYDISALISMVVLSNLSFSAPYMGNTSLGKLNAADGLAGSPLLKKDKEGFEQVNNSVSNTEGIGYTFHATPNRKLKGFDAEESTYQLRPFAMEGRWGATLRYDFKQDIGQTVTMCRFDPTCSKLFVARGEIVGGIGYETENCTEGVFYKVANGKKFFAGSTLVGNHIPLVYGDIYDLVVDFAHLMGLEVIECE